jgi:hypothetical protein
VTKALAGLTTLANELAENSGVDTSLTGCFDSMFAKMLELPCYELLHLYECVGVVWLLCDSVCERFHYQDSREINDATNDEVRTDSELRPVG